MSPRRGDNRSTTVVFLKFSLASDRLPDLSALLRTRGLAARIVRGQVPPDQILLHLRVSSAERARFVARDLHAFGVLGLALCEQRTTFTETPFVREADHGA